MWVDVSVPKTPTPGNDIFIDRRDQNIAGTNETTFPKVGKLCRKNKIFSNGVKCAANWKYRQMVFIYLSTNSEKKLKIKTDRGND